MVMRGAVWRSVVKWGEEEHMGVREGEEVVGGMKRNGEERGG